MKGPVATVELWEKGRCVFSHAVSMELLQAAVDEGCHLLLVGGDGAPVLGKDAMVPLGNGVWGAMEPKTNVSSESHRKGAFRSPAHPPGITL